MVMAASSRMMAANVLGLIVRRLELPGAVRGVCQRHTLRSAVVAAQLRDVSLELVETLDLADA